MRYPLIDGQGNFGSVDNDPPAAMRYTEARMSEIAEEMLADIDKNTVDFVSNFDDSLKEPSVLPSKLPNFCSMALPELRSEWPPIFRLTILTNYVMASFILSTTQKQL